MMSTYLKGLLLSAWIAIPMLATSQQLQLDTLHVSPQQAEHIFLQQNLPLLIEQLNINQAEAEIIQAKVWPNPQLSLEEIQVYGSTWQQKNVAFQLEQLIQTAGKRKKSIAIAYAEKAIAEAWFADFIAALKTEFRQQLSELGYLQAIIRDYEFQKNELDKLILAMQSQFDQGHISQAELYRLKALTISLRSELNELLEARSSVQQNLKSMMRLEPKSHIVLIQDKSDQLVLNSKKYQLDELLSLAESNNALLALRQEVQVSRAELALEKANKTPDLSFKASYDRYGGVINNFVGVGMAIDLPIFDRNKGNINRAQLEIQKRTWQADHKKDELHHQITKTWQDLIHARNLYESMDMNDINTIENMSIAIIKNFQQSDISLLEFLDFFESFRESKEKHHQSIRNIHQKIEELHYLIGSDFSSIL